MARNSSTILTRIVLVAAGFLAGAAAVTAGLSFRPAGEAPPERAAATNPVEPTTTVAAPAPRPSELPSIARLAPATGFPGTALLLTVIGAGLDKVWRVEVEPSDGIVVQGDPMPTALGTMLTVPITVKPDAAPGKRTVTAINRAGQRSSPIVNATFLVSRPPVNALSPENLALRPGTNPVASVMSPTGSGSRDPRALIDGRLETSCCGQFDTFDGRSQTGAFLGFESPEVLRFNAFEIQVGVLAPNGGWFQGGTTRLEVQTEAGWTRIADVYWENGAPESAAIDGSPLVPFSVRSAKFPTVAGTGIRIAGVPSSGAQAYVSAGEIAAYFRQPPIVESSDWTMYRYDLTHTGRAPAGSPIDKSSVARLREKWSVSLTPNAVITQSGVFATPVVSGGIVYAGTMNGWIHALRLDSGQEVWKSFTTLRTENPLGENGVVATPAVHGDTVYVGGDDASVWALDAKTGDVRWRTQLALERFDAIYASPMVVGDRLIIGIANGMSDQPCSVGRVVSLQASDGKTLWTTSMTFPDRPGAGVWATPAVDLQKNRIYVATGNTCFPADVPVEGLYYDSLLGLDLTSGAVEWVYHHLVGDTDDLDFGSSPVMFEERAAAVSKSGWLVAVNQLSGALAWQTVVANRNATPYDGGGVNSPSYGDGRIYTGGGPISGPPDAQTVNYRGSFLAVDPIDGHVIWRQPLASAPLGASAFLNGTVLVGDGLSLVAFDAETGQVLHRITNQSLMWGGISISGGCVLVGDFGGLLHCYTIDGR